jgi:pimeloyl-ACP methyl ester carboxylesterase
VIELDIAGARIAAAWWDGDRAAPPLVLLHEGLGCVEQWRDVPARVAAVTGRRVFAYDRLGYGRSAPVTLPRPLDYMEREGRDVLPRVLDAAGIDRAVLVGHSDGASIAIVFAAEHPARTEALVLEAPHVFVEDLSVASIAKAKEEYEHGPLRAALAKYHADVDVAFRGWNDAWLDPSFRSWSLTSYVARIRAPVLVVQAEDDPYGTLAQVDAITSVTGAERLVFPTGGHAPHRTRAEETIDAIARFVAPRS